MSVCIRIRGSFVRVEANRIEAKHKLSNKNTWNLEDLIYVMFFTTSSSLSFFFLHINVSRWLDSSCFVSYF